MGSVSLSKLYDIDHIAISIPRLNSMIQRRGCTFAHVSSNLDSRSYRHLQVLVAINVLGQLYSERKRLPQSNE